MPLDKHQKTPYPNTSFTSQPLGVVTFDQKVIPAQLYFVYNHILVFIFNLCSVCHANLSTES